MTIDLLLLEEDVRVERIFMEDYMRNRKNGIPYSKRCSFIMSPDTIAIIPYGIAFSKEFKMKPLFDNV